MADLEKSGTVMAAGKAQTSHASSLVASIYTKRVRDLDVAFQVLQSGVEELKEPVSTEQEHALVRKIDLRILPLLIINYIFFYVDKTSLSYAAVFGLVEDLHLVGNQYSWLSALFYLGFLAWVCPSDSPIQLTCSEMLTSELQVFPTTFLLQKLPLAKYLGASIFMWGVFLMIQAACNSFGTLGVMRVLAGAAEAGAMDTRSRTVLNYTLTLNSQRPQLHAHH